MKASEVRESLPDILEEVKRGRRDVLIERNDKTVAVLTRTHPVTGTPALPISAEQARRGWSELLEYVISVGARFELSGKTGRPVYLLRAPGHHNRWSKEWRAHRQRHKAVVPSAPAKTGEQLPPPELMPALETRLREIRMRADKQLEKEFEELSVALTPPVGDDEDEQGLEPA